MAVMLNQAWSISRIVLKGMDGKALHLDTVCSLFIFRVFVCVCVCARVSDLTHGFGGKTLRKEATTKT